MSFQAIARIMADKVYTSAEFKRERDNFHVSTINANLFEGSAPQGHPDDRGWINKTCHLQH